MRNCPHLISPAFYAIKKATQLSQESLDRKKNSEVVRTVCHQGSGPPTEVQTISCMFSGKRTRAAATQVLHEIQFEFLLLRHTFISWLSLHSWYRKKDLGLYRLAEGNENRCVKAVVF